MENQHEPMDNVDNPVSYGGFTPGGLLHSYFAEQQESEKQLAVHRQISNFPSLLLRRYMSATNDEVLPTSAFGISLSMNSASQPQAPSLLNPTDRSMIALNAENAPLDPSRIVLDHNDVTKESDVFAQHGMLGPWSATSAKLLGNLTLSSQEVAKKPKRKERGSPKRPLSAYNLFFRDERSKILKALKKQKEECPESKQEDDKKIGFENLTKIIAQRWHDLSPDRSEYYKALATKDRVRYRTEMDVFIKKKASQNQQTLDQSAGGGDANPIKPKQSSEENSLSPIV